jgi:hypothetical protein
MNAELRKQWVAALRSGAYQQGHGCLYTTRNKYCCLGVLCDLYVQTHKEVGWELYRDDYWMLFGHPSLPTTAVMRWAGLSSSDIDRLVTMNDFDDKTFAEIADVIEKEI